MKFLILILFLVLVFPGLIQAGETKTIREDFADLNNWEELHFKKIPAHSTYTPVNINNENFLKLESSASASALQYKKTFNVYENSTITFRWKTSNIFENAEWKKKKGDDFPLRIYVVFKFDPKKANVFKKIKYKLYKTLYGKYPPEAAINYVWSSDEPTPKIIRSPYTKKAAVIAVEWGSQHIGKWREYTRNIIEDYRLIFKKDPPAEAGIFIMNDSDNTGEAAISYIDFIELDTYE